MAQTTIEWTWQHDPSSRLIPGYTFNVVWGCQRVSEGCKHCYAESMASRFGYHLWGPNAERRVMSPSYWAAPLSWNREAEMQGYPRLVFCSSMADVFEENATVKEEREKLWPLIGTTPSLIWLLLTKRPYNIMPMAPYGESWPDNIWVGTSVENETRANERIPALLQVPTRVRFLSCEPLLGPLNLLPWLPFLQWVIVGGESGRQPRRMNPEWALSLRDQCKAEGVPYFFKQWGGTWHGSLGRMLNGQVYDEMPVIERR